jgi:hypothetical protein
VEKVDRAQFLRLGAAGALGAAGVGLITSGPASAALPAPTPIGDDTGFFGFAVVAELTSQRWYQQALQVKGLGRSVRSTLSAAGNAKGAHIRRINEQLEGLLASTYLYGTSYAQDSSSRLLLGRLQIFDGQLLAWLRSLAGVSPVPGLPNPIDTEAGGTLLDRYLTIPSFG